MLEAVRGRGAAARRRSAARGDLAGGIAQVARAALDEARRARAILDPR